MNQLPHARLAKVAFAFATMLFYQEAYADFVTTPAGLDPGDQYRLVFITSGTKTAQSATIEDYNTFVDGFGDNAIASDWKAIASTPTVDAIDNTGTTAQATSVPIYNLQGQLVASTYSHLWSTASADLTFAVKYDETGERASGIMWTGTEPGGTASIAPLGNTDPHLEYANATIALGYEKNAQWMQFVDNFANNGSFQFYGISSVLTVAGGNALVPEPSSVIAMGLLGVVGIAGIRRRRREVATA